VKGKLINNISHLILCKHLFLIKLLSLLALLNSCAPSKLTLNQQKYLDRVYILDNTTNNEKEIIEAYIRQKGNYKILGTDDKPVLKYQKLPVGINNFCRRLISEGFVQKNKEKRDAKFDRINQTRIEKIAARNQKKKKNIDDINAKRSEKAKTLNAANVNSKFEYKPLLLDFKPEILTLKDKEKPTLFENIRNIGQIPTLLDTNLTEKSAEQLELFLQTNGYFAAKVKDSTTYRNNHAEVYYQFKLGKRAVIKDYKIESLDDEIISILNQRIIKKIKVGNAYNKINIDEERADMTKFLKENGYYFFSPNYIKFYINTSDSLFEPKIRAEIAPLELIKDSSNQVISYKKHVRYKINKIFITTEFDPFNPNTNINYKDTTAYLNYYFVHNNPLTFKRKAFKDIIRIKSNDYLDSREIQETYKKLTDLKLFKFINLQFTKLETDTSVLNCLIQLNPTIKQSIGLTTEGTNNSGNLGLGGSVVYQNRNTLKGAELLSLKVGGGILAQRILNEDKSSTNFIFNTIELGPEINYNIPRAAFPFNLFRYSKNASPKTNITASYNYQIRQNLFNRRLANISYGLEFNSGKYNRHFFVPVEVSFVNAILQDDSLKKQIENSDDLVYKNGFLDHVTTVSRYTYIFKKEALEFSRFQKFLKLDIESSGNLLRWASELAGNAIDPSGSYRLFGIRFAQFIKSTIDLRIYKNLSSKHKLAYRLSTGVGIPLKNLNTLPFEKIYFSGGPNSNRSWKARTLGPGAYQSTENRLDNFGDILLESNFEYRFDIYKFIKGAAFADAGNVWLIRPQKSKENGEFKLNDFYNQIALGSGLGLRFDFTFFIVRLDAGIKLYDPAKERGQRWVELRESVKKPVLNFGIGYPF
jgi:hypothetical protein